MLVTSLRVVVVVAYSFGCVGLLCLVSSSLFAVVGPLCSVVGSSSGSPLVFGGGLGVVGLGDCSTGMSETSGDSFVFFRCDLFLRYVSPFAVSIL